MKRIMSIFMSICLVLELWSFNSSSIKVHAANANTNTSTHAVTYASSTEPGEQEITDAGLHEYTMTDYKKEGTITFSFDENQLSKSATIYNHSLARFSIACSTLIYDSSSKRVRKVLKGLDFKSEESVADTTGTTSPYWICHKKIYLDGTPTEVLLVVIRGTYNEEWLDNFDSGMGVVHEGFQRAADYVYDGMANYIATKNSFDEDLNLKILITGHSRGAATANLLSKKIADEGIKSEDGSLDIAVSQDDLFTYTFATPNTTSESEKVTKKYENIYNIVNPEDFVTKVLPSKWGYRRYGKTYVLPSVTTDNKCFKIGNHVKYSDYLKSVKELYQQYIPDDTYEPYDGGMTRVSKYVDKVTSYVTDIEQYYKKDLGPIKLGGAYSLHELYKYTLGGFMSNNSQYKALFGTYLANIGLGQFGSIGTSTISFFIVNQVIDPLFFYAHTAETYLAGMNTISEAELKQTRKTLKGIVNCPVDVEIKDADGNIISKIENNVVDSSIDESVEAIVDGDSKVFYIPYGDDCTVSLTGNDTGFMDYSLCEIDPDRGEISRINYLNVPVEKGEAYYQSIENDSVPAGLDLIDAEDNTTVQGTIYNEETAGQLSVNITIEGVGEASSLYNLTPGDYVRLSATTDENNVFYGWYDSDGTLISENEEYEFSIKENKSYIAKFSDVVVDVEGINVSNEEIIIDVGSDYYLDAKVTPSNATNKRIQYSSSDEMIARVSDMGMIHAVSPGETTITLQDTNGHEIKCTVIVNGKPYQECNTREEAVLYVREQMVNREDLIKIKYYTSYDENTVSDICNDIINTAISEVTDNPKEGDYLKHHISKQSCTYTYGEENVLYIDYEPSYYTNLEEENDVDEEVTAIMEELNLADKTEIEKIKAIYDWVCGNVAYDFDTLEDDTYVLKYTTYGSMVLGSSVCQGYATLVYRLLKEAGIENRVITGMGNGGSHAWNIVQLDGVYYNIDATWDAGLTGCRYFMKSDASFEDHIRDELYDTEEFHTLYSMATADYSTSCQHQSVVDQGIEATCTEDGLTEGAHCDKCGMVIKEQFILSATGHNWDLGTVTVEPTTESTGIKTYICQSCNESKTEVIDKLVDSDTPDSDTPDSDTPDSNTPLPINTVDDLLSMTSDHSYILMNDLDFTGVSYTEEGYVSINNSDLITPYYLITNYFNNVFDGNGHTISNMQAPLFYALGCKGVIKNVNFEFNYQEQQESCESIVTFNTGLIEDCSVKYVKKHAVQSESDSNLYISFIPENNAEGILKNIVFTIDIDIQSNKEDRFVHFGAGNRGTIINCEYNGQINCGKMEITGGVVGYQNNGSIINCINNVNVTSGSLRSFGGIVYYNSGILVCCTNRGNITADKAISSVGGIVGESNNIVSRCMNEGTISVKDQEGSAVSTVIGGVYGTAITECCINSGDFYHSDDYYNAVIIAAAENVGTFDENDQFCSINNLSVWGNEDRTGSESGLYGIVFEDFYERPTYYRKIRTEKADLLPFEYIELPVGEFIDIPVLEEYVGKIHFLERIYHDNRDDYYNDRTLCTTSGCVGVETVEYYNCWVGEQTFTIYAYTDDGKYDYLIVRLSENCEEVTYNEHLMFDGFSKCAFVHVGDVCNHQVIKNASEEATCTKAGYTGDEVCTACGEVVKKGKVISKLGHAWGEDVVITPATRSSDGSKTKYCTRNGCNAKKEEIKIYKASDVKLSTASYTYDGKTKSPTAYIKDSHGKTISSDNYTITKPSGRKNVGQYTYKIRFKNQYSGTVSLTLKINPKGTSLSKVTAAKKAFTVKWKKQSGKMATARITGYEVQYSTSKKFTNPKSKTITGYKSTSKKMKGLKAKKTYYVRIRTYKTVKVNGKSVKLYSSWSASKSIKTK